MKNIKIILNENKTFTAENIDEVKILEDEHNATVIEVHFPEDYVNYSKRVDFLNIRNEKWTTSLYAPEDENNNYSETFDKSVFRFTIPSAMAKRGELQIQFIAYLVDGSNTIVPFQVILATINKSIIYAVKEGRENPDLLIQAYEYSNKALGIAREALDKTANAERAALEAEKSANNAENSAKNAENSAKSAQTSANSANTRAINAESSARSAQESAEYAEEVSNTANTKSDNAVRVSNEANTKSDQAVTTANTANENSEEALDISNQADTKATNAVNTSNLANEKSDNAVTTSNNALEIAQEAKDIANTANTKSDNAVDIATESNTKSDNAVATATSANTKSNQAVTTANEAKTSATSAVNTANSANTKSNTAVSTANSANTKSDNAVSVANEAKTTAEEALNQVVSKMGTKVFIGNNTNPEANVNFDSDPQTQIADNKTLSNNNKTRLDGHDSTLATHTNKLSTHDSEISSAKSRLTSLENQPIIKKILYDENGNAFEFDGTWKSGSLELNGTFTALKNIGGGFQISDSTNVGMEIGRVDGTPGTPYLDFHTDGNKSTDYNVRMLASGNALYFTASDGLFLNNKKMLAVMSSANISATLTLTGGTSTRTYTRTIGILDLNACAIVNFNGNIDPAYVANKGSWYNFNLNISSSAFSTLRGRGFTGAKPLSYSLFQADGDPMNDYTNSQVQQFQGVSYSDSGGVNINFSFKKYFGEDNCNHNMNIALIIV